MFLHLCSITSKDTCSSATAVAETYCCAHHSLRWRWNCFVIRIKVEKKETTTQSRRHHLWHHMKFSCSIAERRQPEGWRTLERTSNSSASYWRNTREFFGKWVCFFAGGDLRVGIALSSREAPMENYLDSFPNHRPLPEWIISIMPKDGWQLSARLAGRQCKSRAQALLWSLGLPADLLLGLS